MDPQSHSRQALGALPARLTLGDLDAFGVLAGAVKRLTVAERDIPLSGVRLFGQATGGTHDLLVTESVPTSIPEGVVAVVTRKAPRGTRSVPVLVGEPGADWLEILQSVTTLFTGGGMSPLVRHARAALRVPLVEGGGWERIAQVVVALVGGAVVIVDDHLEILAHHAGPDGAPPPDIAGKTFAEILRVDEDDDRLVIPILGHRDSTIAAIVAATAERVPEGVFNEITDACTLEWSRQELRVATESQLRGDLIREIMAGESLSRESLLRRARHLGADLAGGAVALVGALHGDTDADTGDVIIGRRLVRHARSIVDLHWPRALVDADGGRLLVLLPGPRGDDVSAQDVEERAHTLATRLIAAAGDALPGLTLAISRFTPDPERLGAAMEEASLALSIGMRLGREGDVITFAETGTYKLLFQIFADRPEELAGFYEQTIAPLVRYDEQYQTELVGTLATYLELDGNLAATASQLFTHRHTVRYRLDRIAGLSGLDIGRTDDREKLTLGLKAMRLLGKKVPVPLAKEGNARAR